MELYLTTVYEKWTGYLDPRKAVYSLLRLGNHNWAYCV